jgi:bacterioferritin-associated ferredoxin
MQLSTITAEARVCDDPCAGPCAGCPDRIVCRCLKVTEAVIVEAIVALGVRTVKELKAVTGAGDGCTVCHCELREYLEAHVETYAAPPNICSAR